MNEKSQAQAGTMDRARLRRVKLVFSGIYFFFMLARAVFGPFITVYLEEKGLSAEQIGVITGINSFVIILSQPLWGIVSDRMRSTRKTLVLCVLFQAVFAMSLLLASDMFLIAAAFIIYTSFSSSEGPLMDTWALTSIKSAGDPNGMGPVKMWGCIGFSLSSVVSGMFISRYSTSAVIPIFSGMLLILSIVLLLVKTEGAPAKASSLRDMQLGRVFRDKRFLVFLTYTFFMQLAHRGNYTFYPLLIKRLGGDNALVGYASALMFVSEAVIMFLSKKMLKKVKPEVLVMASSFAFALWHLLLSFAQAPVHVVLACLMDGPSFALFTIGVLYYMDSIAPPDIRTTYQTVAYSIYFGLSGIVGNVFSGWMIENLGYRPMYWIGIGVTVGSTLVFALYRKNAGARRGAGA
ncbi:MFS transporter [Acutalibacter sp.]|jgi:oligosaccharide:H+ symporter|uniref:MFS transporter n=1 Tax=Acutalibacter sp. TaxID=1918636 RepID=UPI0021718B73|nr:MFS transporter [Acutalibacter sp.]